MAAEVEMKRYMLFGGDVYYPKGGFADFLNSYDTLDESIESVLRSLEQRTIEWWHIVDTHNYQIVRHSDHPLNPINSEVAKRCKSASNEPWADTWGKDGN